MRTLLGGQLNITHISETSGRPTLVIKPKYVTKYSRPPSRISTQDI